MIVPGPTRSRATLSHRYLIEQALGPMEKGNYTPATSGLLILCFTNRCGSNHLAALLASTGAFNEAGEYFNADTVLHHARARGLNSLREYVSVLPSLVPGAGAWLVAKASLEQTIMLADAGIFAEHPHVAFILLERRDLLAQAVSRCIAAQNDRWTAAQRAEHPDSALSYNRAAIERTIADVAADNAGFCSLFTANAIVPIHLAHEDVLRNPAGAISQIGQAVGLPNLKPDTGTIRLQKQAGELNTQWHARYEAGL